jgi:hypothetical protein
MGRAKVTSHNELNETREKRAETEAAKKAQGANVLRTGLEMQCSLTAWN